MTALEVVALRTLLRVISTSCIASSADPTRAGYLYRKAAPGSHQAMLPVRIHSDTLWMCTKSSRPTHSPDGLSLFVTSVPKRESLHASTLCGGGKSTQAKDIARARLLAEAIE